MNRKIFIVILVLSFSTLAFSAGLFNAFYFGGGIGVMTLYSTPSAHSLMGVRAPYVNAEFGSSYLRFGGKVYFTTVKVMPVVYAGLPMKLFAPNNYFGISMMPYGGVLVEKEFNDSVMHYGGVAGVSFKTTRRFRGGFNKLEGFINAEYTYIQNETKEVVVSLGFQFGM